MPPSPSPFPSPVRLVALLLGAELLTMVGVFTFPALLPTFFEVWRLSNTEAGWISGIYFAGYTLSVPLLMRLTDRIDAKRVYMAGAAVTALSALAFAVLADGFWSAMIFRALAGAGLAGTYMPGLRVLVDRYEGRRQARAVSFYTAGFSLGTALSFLFAGELGAVIGWEWTFAVAGFAALGAAGLMALAFRPITPQAEERETHFLDFRPVLRNRPALGFMLAYGAHSWELFALRSWLVAFLAFSVTLQPGAGAWPAPTTVAMLSALAAVAASIGGQELSTRFGLRRVIPIVMLTSGAIAFVLGFLPGLPYLAVTVLVLVYSVAVQGDSAALTIGTIQMARQGQRGATLALHSLIGFGGAALGPLVVGVVLDASGGADRVSSWGLAFASVGLVAVAGPALLLALTRSATAPPHGADTMTSPPDR